MKKILTVTFVILTVLCTFAGCNKKQSSAQSSTASSASQSSAKTYKVGVAIYQYDDSFMTLYRNEIKHYFKSLETDSVRYKLTMHDGKNDMAEQSNQVDQMIAAKMDVIILNLIQASSAEVLIDRIVAAKIPCILINREPEASTFAKYDKVCYIGADARQSGTMQGKIVLSLKDKGDINGDGVVSYIMLEGDPENSDAQYRTQFSVKALTDAGVKVECLDDQVGNWAQTKGQEICANALAKFGKKVEVVFCNNDAMALGAAAAIQAAGRTVGKDIYLLGVDALDECQEMVKKGTMTGTVLNDHIGQAHSAVDAAIRAIKGEKLEKYYWVDYVMVKGGLE